MKAPFLLLILVQTVFSLALPVSLSRWLGNDAASPKEHSEVLFFEDNIWTTTVVIGTPGEVFNVAVDTTSGFLFVSDITCSNCNDSAVFDSSQSTTYHDSKHQYHENSRFGTVRGEIGEDTVVLGENASTSVTVPRATFGQTTQLGGHLPPGVDGILGLAFPSTAPQGTEPIFERAIQERVVDAGIFTIWLEDQYATSDNGTHGVIYYGNNDNLHCKVNQRHVYPLTNAHYFQFTIASVNVGSYQWRTRSQAYIDSLSPYIAAPAQFVTSVLQHLGLSANSAHPTPVSCDQQITFSFNFNLGTENVTQLNIVYPRDDGSCVLGLTINPNNEFALGYPFLRGRCTYFDYANHKIGFSEPITHGSEHDNATSTFF